MSAEPNVSATEPAGAVATATTADAGLALSPDDQALLKELEAASAQLSPTAGQTTLSRSVRERESLLTFRGGANPFSNLYNPAVSLNGLLLATATTGPGDTARAGLDVQELELQLAANVDPYFSASATFAVSGLSTFEIEEAYLSALPQPLGLSFRAGKFRVPFGRENPYHSHALPFVERSLVQTAVFGEEGLSEVAVEGSWLAPVPWYALLTVVAADGANDALFDSPAGRDLAGVAALRNVIDLTDDATLEAGLSYAVGRNVDQLPAQALGAHVVVKWRPARDALNRSMTATIEALGAHRPSAPLRDEPPPLETGGLSASLQWQLTRGWYLGARFEWLAERRVEVDVTMKQSALLVFAPTEFSAFRLQANVREPPAAAPLVIEAFLQANFTIGAHPAHAY